MAWPASSVTVSSQIQVSGKNWRTRCTSARSPVEFDVRTRPAGRGGRGGGGRRGHRTGRRRGHRPRPSRPRTASGVLELLALRHLLVGEHDEAGVLEGVFGARDHERAAHPFALVQFGLRLHVERFELGEHLLQVQPVLGQDEHRAVHGHQSDFGLALGLHVHLHLVARLGLLGAERGGHRLRILALHVERDGVGRHLAVRQYLVDEQLRLRGHGRRDLERDVGPELLPVKTTRPRDDHFVVEVARLGGGRHLKLAVSPTASAACPCCCTWMKLPDGE